MRKRVMAVAAIGLLVAGAWLGNFFRGFGLGGPGAGQGGDDQPSPDTQVSLNTDSSAASSISTSSASDPKEQGTAEPSDDVLTVLIAEDTYQIQSGADAAASFTLAKLDEVVEQAKLHPGDAHGVRVRLRFRRSAHSGATSDLYEALQAAGIPREQIIESTGYVE
jgi:hypothetical protein